MPSMVRRTRESTTLGDFSLAAVTEYKDWEAGLTRARPTDGIPRGWMTTVPPSDEHGLPMGWRTVACLRDYQPDTDLWLTRRDGGGWVVVRYERDLERTQIFWVDESLADLYTHVVEAIAEGHRFPAGMDAIAEWLKGVLTEMFDSEDPVEAAEQVLFALGGVLSVVPRAATQRASGASEAEGPLNA